MRDDFSQSTFLATNERENMVQTAGGGGEKKLAKREKNGSKSHTKVDLSRSTARWMTFYITKHYN